MADIHVQPNNQVLKLKFQFNSPQQFFYTVTLINRERNQQIFRDKGQWDGKTEFDLGEADDLIGIYLIIDWTVIDPAGSGLNFNAEAITLQDDIECVAHQKCTGITTSDAAFQVTVGKFVINSL